MNKNNDQKDRILATHLMEYDKLKEEQTSRIGFRDNLLYVTLVVFGGVFSYSVGDIKNNDALLVLPLVSSILGWTYLLNDKKISEIKSYLRNELSERVKLVTDESEKHIFGWESRVIDREAHQLKKSFQLFINLLTFCFSGLGAMVVFYTKSAFLSNLSLLFIVFGALILIILGGLFIRNSEIFS